MLSLTPSYISTIGADTYYLIWQVEIKNLNSFSSISRAIDFEISRQARLHSEGLGDQIVQETRLWEEGAQVVFSFWCCLVTFLRRLCCYFKQSSPWFDVQKTVTMRKKEGLSDYRYFPEPDLPEITLTEGYVNNIQNSLPELPEMKRRRYEKMGLSMQDVLFLANDMNVCPKS